MRTRFVLTLGSALCVVAPWAAGFGLAESPRGAAILAAPGEPELTAIDAVHDFGTVFEGAELNHTFSLKAGGGADLVIQKVRPGCGCTVANMSVTGPDGEQTAYEEGSPLAPGSELTLETTFRTAGKKGNQSKPIQIYANIPQGSIELTIKAQVRPFLKMLPERIVLDRFSIREEARGSAEVRSFDGAPIALELPEQGYPDGLAVALDPVDPDEAGLAKLWKVSVHMGKGAPEGPFHHMLRIRAKSESGGAEEPAEGSASGRGGQISIAGQVLGLITSTPSYITFGALRGSDGTARTIRVNSNASDIELSEPKLTLFDPRDEAPFQYAEHFRATARAVEDVPGAWDVELWAGDLPESINGAFRGNLRVDFNHPELTPLEIPFTGFHRP